MARRRTAGGARLPVAGPARAAGPPALGPSEGGLRNAAQRVVAEAVERAGRAAPDVDVTHAVVTGEPLTVLEAQSRAAELVVVGSRGMGGFVGLMLGSTAVHLAAHGQCPVLVVREQPAAGGPVLLGVDGSPAGADAVDFAFAEAALRGAELLALHAWTPWHTPVPPPQDPAMPYASEPGELARTEERLVAETITDGGSATPGSRSARKRCEARPARPSSRRAGPRSCSSSAHADAAASPGWCSAPSARRSCTTRTARSPWCAVPPPDGEGGARAPCCGARGAFAGTAWPPAPGALPCARPRSAARAFRGRWPGCAGGRR